MLSSPQQGEITKFKRLKHVQDLTRIVWDRFLFCCRDWDQVFEEKILSRLFVENTRNLSSLRQEV